MVTGEGQPGPEPACPACGGSGRVVAMRQKVSRGRTQDKAVKAVPGPLGFRPGGEDQRLC